MNISIVVPSFNESESLPELCSWIDKVMQENSFSYEIVIADDGSTDNSWEVIQQLSKTNCCIKGIKFRRNYGKSAALNLAFAKVQGDVVITMDADLQDSPEEIPELYRLIKEDGWDLVSGWKKKRYDPITKTVPTKLYNWAARKASGIYLHDFNCGLKSYRKDVVKNIELYGEMHRYIPVLAVNAGFTDIVEKVVIHQARKYGKTKFGMERFINGFLDLITIWFTSKFGRRPMHFFGFLGVVMFMIGLGFASYLGIDKLFLNPSGRLIASRPEFFIALTTMVIGTQFFVAGFLGEIVLQSRQNKERYLISEATDA